MTDLRAIAEQLVFGLSPIHRPAAIVERAMRLAIDATRRWSIWQRTGILTKVPLSSNDAKILEIMLELMKAEAQSSEINESDSLGLPMVLRATGRTIPDLTKREHVCEYQALMKAEAHKIEDPPARWCCVGDDAKHEHSPDCRYYSGDCFSNPPPSKPE